MFDNKRDGNPVGKILKVIFVCILTVCNLYFIVTLTFYTDKFKKPYAGINEDMYLVGGNSSKVTDGLSIEEKVADFRFLTNFLYENYPLINIDEEIYGTDYENKNERFLKLIENTDNDFEFYLLLRQYFSTVKSAHTYILHTNYEMLEKMKINNADKILEDVTAMSRMKYWLDCLYENVIKYSDDNIVAFKYINGKYYETKKYGNYITDINGMKVQEFVKNHESILHKKFNFERNALYYDYLIFNRDYGEQVTIQMSNGKIYNLYYAPEYEFSYISVNSDEEQPSFFYIIDEEKRVCYYRIDSFRYDYLNKIKTLSEEILDKKESIDYVIFDIRNNSGGSIETFVDGILNEFINEKCNFTIKYYTPFTEFQSDFVGEKGFNKITKSPVEGLKNRSDYYYVNKLRIIYGKSQETTANNFKKFFILINDETGSAADTFAAIMKDGGHAILVGQNTAGEGLGDTCTVIKLPNSGLIVSFMGAYGLNKDGTSNTKYGTAPDFYVSQNVTDYKHYKKKAYDDLSDLIIDDMLQYDTQLRFIIENLIMIN